MVGRNWHYGVTASDFEYSATYCRLYSKVSLEPLCNFINFSRYYSSTIPYDPVLPVIVGEYGSDDGSCRPLDGLLGYMHSKASGYSAWTYDTGGNPCNRPRMIDSWSGDPNAYGQAMYVSDNDTLYRGVIGLF